MHCVTFMLSFSEVYLPVILIVDLSLAQSGPALTCIVAYVVWVISACLSPSSHSDCVHVHACMRMTTITCKKV